jgi:hypothetical protein
MVDKNVSLTKHVDLPSLVKQCLDVKALQARSSVTVLKSSILRISLSVDNVASPANCSCDTVEFQVRKPSLC